jgi:glycogen synthase
MFAGDPSPHKGIDTLLECWREDPPPAQLVVATTRKLDAALPDGVLVGRLSREEIGAAWRAATVAVVPSRWADPCPTVVLEAMAAGTPVVGSAIGGIAHLVRDGIDGVLVTPGSSVELRAAVGALLSDAGLRQRLGAAGVARADSFRAAVVVPRIERAYVAAITRRLDRAG